MELQFNLDLDPDLDPTPSACEGVDYPERSLWSAVIGLAIYEATHGDLDARKWFSESKGTFPLCANILGLSEAHVRRRMEQVSFKQKGSRQPRTLLFVKRRSVNVD